MKFDVYFIEYADSIKFFKDNISFDMIKNSKTYTAFKKVLDSKKYNFIDLLALS